MIRRFGRRFGRRGVFLMMVGALYVATGAITLAVDIRRFGLPVFGAALDSPLWGIMWLLGGLAAIVVGLARPRPDGPGFVALLVPPAIWTILYLASLVTWLASGGTAGRLTSLAGVVVWSITWTVVLVVSGWPDPSDERTGQRRGVRRRGGGGD